MSDNQDGKDFQSIIDLLLAETMMLLLFKLGLKSTPYSYGKEEHTCDEDGQEDIDICRGCGEHASFCSECGESSCCGTRASQPDDGWEGDR
jgi:hypothetical protein